MHGVAWAHDMRDWEKTLEGSVSRSTRGNRAPYLSGRGPFFDGARPRRLLVTGSLTWFAESCPRCSASPAPSLAVVLPGACLKSPADVGYIRISRNLQCLRGRSEVRQSVTGTNANRFRPSWLKRVYVDAAAFCIVHCIRLARAPYYAGCTKKRARSL